MPQFQKAPFWQSQALSKPQVLLVCDNVWEHPPKALCPDKEQNVLDANRQSTDISLIHLDAAWQIFQH
ncbi:MAG: hypothetical protein VKJ04_03000 [Vampirovibrionales bacterium]|nr:hypothetical protein [Vampirovibrionales bacterium]